jgi:hypothetical protein
MGGEEEALLPRVEKIGAGEEKQEKEGRCAVGEKQTTAAILAIAIAIIAGMEFLHSPFSSPIHFLLAGLGPGLAESGWMG